ncbi:MAG: BlaI/MecI/CopY family transcriptional regulator [Muribaculaceae bacterium]|nr:BlaI/MecI/CopY family transcriptional regulator [Bacteroides sp.]MDE6228054.1 BlaI/MecI/CopY family transcriptional regulator [Muribaculaceae bacterium]
MDRLTAKEEEIMNIFWKHGAMCVREIVEMYEEPRPHFNTISTMVRALEEKGYVGHRQQGKSYQYYPLIAEEEMGKQSLSTIIGRYFKNSYLKVVSAFVEDGNIPVEELRSLLEEVEKQNKMKEK